MDVIIYPLFICLVTYIVITLLPMILPTIVIIVITFSIFVWYAKREVCGHMEGYENGWNQQQKGYTAGDNPSLDPDNVTDMEPTERDDE